MPAGFLRNAAFAAAAIGLPAQPVFPLAGDVPSPEYVTSMEMARLAEVSSVPIAYFSQSAALCRDCWGLQAGSKGSPKDSLCRGIKQAGAGFEPGRAMDKGSLGQLTVLRRRIVEAFAADFRADSVFLGPDWGPRLRLAAYLDTGDFLEWASRMGSLRDSVRLALQSASDTLRICRGSPWVRKGPRDSSDTRPSSPPARGPDGKSGTDFLYHLIPDLDLHLEWDRWSKAAGSTALCLRDEACRDLFVKYDSERLYALLPDDSLRQKIPVSWESAFIHKLKRCLADAIWFPDGKAPSEINYSAFFFRMNFVLGAADSLLISRSIEDFGKRNADLCQRVGDGNWDQAKWRRLDSLAGRTAWMVSKGISLPARNFLTYKKNVDDLTLPIMGGRYPDFFGELKLAQRLGQLVATVDADSFPRWGAMVFPFLPPDRLQRLFGMARSDKRSVLRFLKESGSMEKNYIQFVMGRTLYFPYKGDLRGLERLEAGETKL